MKKIICFTLFFYSCNFLCAQQFPSSTHINYNHFFFNPGYIGSSESSSVILSHQSKWQDIEGAPRTRFFGAYSPFKKGISFGVNFLNDVIGPTTTNAFFASSSYTVSFGNNSTLSMGLRLGFSQYAGNLSSVSINDPLDPVFLDASLNEYIPNMGFGLYYNYFDNYFLGFSIPSFIQNTYYQGKEQRTYFLTAGKSFKFFPDHIIKTAFILSGTRAVPLKWDINVCYFSEFALGAGFNYSHNESISPILYAEISEILSLGYSYSIPIGDVLHITDNTHEIILRINFIE
jgi:type IX secretion system PorP/SprF family membrane protein